ncbi:hypothetical protein H5T58_03445 [Candidatus Parcubacteria bacterium]|nr:hypothetical protein [Candidatus Parcubacteria bacterium]
MEKFYCENCQKVFEAEGEKKEWESSIFGKCWKLVAKCPSCKKECNEWRPGAFGSSKSCGGSCPLCSGCK